MKSSTQSLIRTRFCLGPRSSRMPIGLKSSKVTASGNSLISHFEIIPNETITLKIIWIFKLQSSTVYHVTCKNCWILIIRPESVDIPEGVIFDAPLDLFNITDNCKAKFSVFDPFKILIHRQNTFRFSFMASSKLVINQPKIFKLFCQFSTFQMPLFQKFKFTQKFKIVVNREGMHGPYYGMDMARRRSVSGSWKLRLSGMVALRMTILGSRGRCRCRVRRTFWSRSFISTRAIS